MKYYSIFIDRHHSQEGAYGYETYFSKDTPLEEVKRNVLIELLEDHFGVEVSDLDKEEILSLCLNPKKDRYIILSSEDSDICLWSLDDGRVGMCESYSYETIDKYEARWVSFTYTKELLKKVNFVAENPQELPCTFKDQNIKVGLFKYNDDTTKLEPLKETL